MKISPTKIHGAYLLELEAQRDERGFFARAFCPKELAAAGISFESTQINLSRNSAALTLRGLHFRPPPLAEAKIVRVVRGSAYDAIVDLRGDSPSHGQALGLRLTAEEGQALFIPEGCAHGFLTLEDETDILYQMSRPYEPGPELGLRWSDPAFAIAWPASPKVISARDSAWPDYGA